jgi:hypothetical protein
MTMYDAGDEDTVFMQLEQLCERIILSPEHIETRDSLSRFSGHGWTNLEMLIPANTFDGALARHASASGQGITSYVVKEPLENYQIVTFYCSGLNAVVGTGLIDALEPILTTPN